MIGMTPFNSRKLVGLSFRLTSSLIHYNTAFNISILRQFFPQVPSSLIVSVPGVTLESIQDEITWTINEITKTINNK